MSNRVFVAYQGAEGGSCASLGERCPRKQERVISEDWRRISEVHYFLLVRGTSEDDVPVVSVKKWLRSLRQALRA